MFDRRKLGLWLLVAAAILAACSPTALLGSATPLSPKETDAAATEVPLEENGSETGSEEESAMTSERSYAGTVPAPEFPTGLDWLNTAYPLTLAQLRGKVVVLDFWTYGCINCIHIIPDLKRLEEEYPDELVVIGVHSAKFSNEGDTENIRQIILRYELEHPVVNDRDFQVWHSWGAEAWPTQVIIDPAGNIAGGHRGEGVYPVFKPVIESLVREFAAKGLLDRTPLELKLEKQGLPETVLSFPGKVLVEDIGDRLFIADTNHNRIVVVEANSGQVLEVIGSGRPGFGDGDFRTAAFLHPQGMTLSADGQVLYVADTENHAIRQVDLVAETVSTLVGTGAQARGFPPQGGVAPGVALNSPWDLALDGDRLYIAMAGTHQIWALDLLSGEVGPLAGSAFEGTRDGPLAQAELAQPSGLALDGQGRLYFADSEGSSIRWAEVGAAEGQVGTLVGSGISLFQFGDIDGVGRQARLQHPLGVAYDQGFLYVADTYNSKIKRVNPETQEIRTFLGGEHGWRDGSDPLFYEPGGLDAANGRLYVADTNNHAVRAINLVTGEVSTLVLRGIERFLPSSDETFFGTVVQLESVDVAAGAGRLRLEVELPAGYKLNDEATHSMSWQVTGGVVTLPAEANRSLNTSELPLELEVTFNRGQGQLTGDFILVYCEQEQASVCLLERVRLEVPLVVRDSGEEMLLLHHRIERP